MSLFKIVEGNLQTKKVKVLCCRCKCETEVEEFDFPTMPDDWVIPPMCEVCTEEWLKDLRENPPFVLENRSIRIVRAKNIK